MISLWCGFGRETLRTAGLSCVLVQGVHGRKNEEVSWLIRAAGELGGNSVHGGMHSNKKPNYFYFVRENDMANTTNRFRRVLAESEFKLHAADHMFVMTVAEQPLYCMFSVN